MRVRAYKRIDFDTSTCRTAVSDAHSVIRVLCTNTHTLHSGTLHKSNYYYAHSNLRSSVVCVCVRILFLRVYVCVCFTGQPLYGINTAGNMVFFRAYSRTLRLFHLSIVLLALLLVFIGGDIVWYSLSIKNYFHPLCRSNRPHCRRSLR